MASPSARVLELAAAGEFRRLRALFAPAQRRRISEAALQASWSEHVTRHGPIKSVIEEEQSPATHVSRLITAGAELRLVVAMDDAGRLTNIQVTPVPIEWAWPGYADPARFDEAEVEVGGVGGTLTRPRAPGQHPAVVMLAGGGPFDRDMTMGNNRIGKDLAGGLATAGVASIRFDKPTDARTPTEEYLPAARAAIDVLLSDPSIDLARIALLGHSMGGTMVPRIAREMPQVAGLILLAAQAQPMHEAAVRTFRYLASVEPSPGVAASLTAVTRQARRVARGRLTARTSPRLLPFGYPGEWWLDLKGYDPVVAARAQTLPVLVLQGGRDYQVTVADNLERWMLGLADRADVTFRTYPEDNHLFFVGTGPSRPAEYDPPQHVDPRVISDVAGWMRALPPL
jgi:uncharacterized protein